MTTEAEAKEAHAKRLRERQWPFKIYVPPAALGLKTPLRAPRTGYATDSEPPATDAVGGTLSAVSPPSAPAPSSASSSHPPDLSRHARRCSICLHPDRDVIDAEFIRWTNPDQLARHFNVGGRSAIYRHANATGLFRRRKRELCRVLESILETADSANFETAEVLIRAARIYSHLDDEGRWYEPPKTITILHGPAPAASAPKEEPGDTIEVLTGTPLHTEIPVTP
jgi:hypothetical protein